MAKLNWKIIHDCDEEDGTPTCWAAEINHNYMVIGAGLQIKGVILLSK